MEPNELEIEMEIIRMEEEVALHMGPFPTDNDPED